MKITPGLLQELKEMLELGHKRYLSLAYRSRLSLSSLSSFGRTTSLATFLQSSVASNWQ